MTATMLDWAYCINCQVAGQLSNGDRCQKHGGRLEDTPDRVRLRELNARLRHELRPR